MTLSILRFIAAALAALPLACGATYVFNTINYPGAVMTDVRGINNAGRIVGYASFDNVTFFSFTYESGVFTPLPLVPGGPGLEAVAHGINDVGDVVGTLVDPAAPSIANAFILRNGTTAYGAFARPGYPATFARAIGNTGHVVGYGDDGAGNTAGYIYDPVFGTYIDITIPGSVFTIAQGINLAGQVVGSAIIPGPNASQAWLRQPGGAITMFQIAGRATRARGINDTGLMTGFTTDAGGVNMAFVANSSGFEDLMVPGAENTFGEAINNAGQVAGLFWTAGGTVTRGFIATPAALPSGTTSSGAYTFTVDVVPGVAIFIDPPVAVGYDYAIGKGNPRIATVRLPIGVGDSMYRVKAQGRKFTLAGGDVLDFRASGFPAGVTDFTVTCIETDAMLDPANPQAFPTELTFMGAGTFTGSMKPLVRKQDYNAKQCLKE